MNFSLVHVNLLFITVIIGFLLFILHHNGSVLNNQSQEGSSLVIRSVQARRLNMLLREQSKELLADLKLVHSWMAVQQKAKKDELMNINKQSKDLAVEILPEFPLTFHHRDVFLCGRSTIKLLILIFSDIKEYEERQIIRNTWAKLEMRSKHSYELRWKRVFVVGYPLEKAGSDDDFVREVMHNDLLGVHSDNSRTMQTLYGALYWALNGCSFEKLLVVKSKMFVNIPAFYKLLHSSSADINRQDLYINTVAMEIANSSKRIQNPMKSFRTYKESSAWLASNQILLKFLPKIRMFMNSKFEGVSNIVHEFMQQIHVNVTRVDNFLTTKGTCKYQADFFISLEQTIQCFPTIQQEYESSLKDKSFI